MQRRCRRPLWLPIVISKSILIRLILAFLVPAISGSHSLPENKHDTVVASDDGHSLRGASISSNKVYLSSIRRVTYIEDALKITDSVNAPTRSEMDGFLFSGLGCKELFSNEEVVYVMDDWHLLQDKIRVSDLPEVVFEMKSDDNQIDAVFTDIISFKDLVLDLPQHIACGVLAQARSQYLHNPQENKNGNVHIIFTPISSDLWKAYRARSSDFKKINDMAHTTSFL